jgi:hypothetical protein
LHFPPQKTARIGLAYGLFHRQGQTVFTVWPLGKKRAENPRSGFHCDRTHGRQPAIAAGQVLMEWVFFVSVET